MATVNARIRSLTKPGRLDSISKHMQQAVETVMESHADKSIAQLQVYPPPKQGSRYVRTGVLRDSWSHSAVRQTRDGLVITINNDASDGRHTYAEWVHGDETGAEQQEQHASTGWPLVADVLREGYRERIRRVLRAL